MQVNEIWNLKILTLQTNRSHAVAAEKLHDGSERLGFIGVPEAKRSLWKIACDISPHPRAGRVPVVTTKHNTAATTRKGYTKSAQPIFWRPWWC